jgi:GTPase
MSPQGVGLGRGFLRHIERCKIIVHIVNGDSPNPLGDFAAINKELQLFSPLLASKPQVVVLNKIDIPSVAEKKEEIMAGLLKLMPHTRLLWCVLMPIGSLQILL